MSKSPVKAVAINAADFMKSIMKGAPVVKVVKAAPAVKAVKGAPVVKSPKASKSVKAAAVVKATPPAPPVKVENPFSTSKGKFVVPFEQDMYGYYDRMGEGVMYKGRWVFEPAFFSPTAKAWDPALVSVELIGFDSSTVSYLKDYGATAKAWEKRVLSCLADDPENFIGECLYEQLTDDQSDFLDKTPHGAAVAAGAYHKAVKAIMKLAITASPHK